MKAEKVLPGLLQLTLPMSQQGVSRGGGGGGEGGSV